MRLLGGFFVLLLWSTLGCAAATEALDKVVAVVNDNVVTQH